MEQKCQNITQKPKSFENVIVQQITSNRTIPILPKPPLLDDTKTMNSAAMKPILTNKDNRPGYVLQLQSLESQLRSTTIPHQYVDSKVGNVTNELTAKVIQPVVEPMVKIHSHCKNVASIPTNSTGSNNNQHLVKILPKLPVKSIQRSSGGNLFVQGPNNKILSLQIKSPNIVPATTLTTQNNSVPISILQSGVSNTNSGIQVTKNMQILQNKIIAPVITAQNQILSTTTPSPSTVPVPTISKNLNVQQSVKPTVSVATSFPVNNSSMKSPSTTQQAINSKNQTFYQNIEPLATPTIITSNQPVQNIIQYPKTMPSNIQSNTVNLQAQLTNNQITAQLKIGDNVVLTPNINQHKVLPNFLPTITSNIKQNNSKMQIISTVPTSNTLPINSFISNSSLGPSQKNGCIETPATMNPASVITTKKILVPVGKISSNITISKAPLNVRTGPIEEPSPSISLIEKRNSTSSGSSTSFLANNVLISSPNALTNLKNISKSKIAVNSSEVNNINSTVKPTEAINDTTSINAEEKKDNNLTISPQYYADSKSQIINGNAESHQVSSQQIAQSIETVSESKIQTVVKQPIVTTHSLSRENINSNGSVVSNQILPNLVNSDAAFKVQNLKDSTENKILNSTTSANMAPINKTKIISSPEKLLKERIATILGIAPDNYVQIAEKTNDVKPTNEINSSIQSSPNQLTLDSCISSKLLEKNQKKDKDTVQYSMVKGRIVKQQSLLKNKNIEMLKRSPRILGRSKSLSVSNRRKKKNSERRFSSSSDNQINNCANTDGTLKENLLSEKATETSDWFEKITNTTSASSTETTEENTSPDGHIICEENIESQLNSKENLKTPKSSTENLNRTLLCEEKIETSPNVSGENSSNSGTNSSEVVTHFTCNKSGLTKFKEAFPEVVEQIDLISTKLEEIKNDSVPTVSNEINQKDVDDHMSPINNTELNIFQQFLFKSAQANSVIQMTGLSDILKWRAGVGKTRDGAIQFRISEIGLLEVFENNIVRNYSDIPYDKSIYMREKQSYKTEDLSQMVYFCRGCNCHGSAVDFLAPEFCSYECFNRYYKKRITEKKTSSDQNFGEQRHRKLRKQQMSTFLNDISTLNPMVSETGTDDVKQEFEWATYLINCDSHPAPIDLFLNPFPCSPNMFQVGMKLEAIDPEYSSLFCVCSVVELKGYRLKIHFDGYSNTYDFWINADSMDIFPPGWCSKTNRPLQPPRHIHPTNFNWSTYLTKTKTIPAPRNLFTHLNSSSNTNPFKIGMRFEADDLRNTRKVCVASVADVLDNRILVHFDGWDDKYDYWVDCNSPYIHPVNWHLQNNFEIVPTPDWEGIKFDWKSYLESLEIINAIAAPEDYFQTREPIQFKVGMKLEVVDKKNPSLIRPASVILTDGFEIKVLFEGWSSEYAFWVVDDSPDIHPIGWCDATGHDLEPPPSFESLPSIMPCPIEGCRGIGNAKRFDIDFHATGDSCPYLMSNWKKEIEKPERVDFNEINRRDVLIMGQKRKLNDSQYLEAPFKYAKVENCDENSNNSYNQLSNYTNKVQYKSYQEHKYVQINIETSEKLYETKVALEQFSNDNDELSFKLNYKLQLTKHLLCDYGPRLKKNYKLWLKYAHEILDESKIGSIEKNPLDWKVNEVIDFISNIIEVDKDLKEKFLKQDIDGEALLSMRREDLTEILHIKLGKAIPIYNVIILLRTEVMKRFT